jgi:uridylate kinase
LQIESGLKSADVELALLCGGGNFLRGAHMDNGLPVVVFNQREDGSVERLLRGEVLGTLIE